MSRLVIRMLVGVLIAGMFAHPAALAFAGQGQPGSGRALAQSAPAYCATLQELELVERINTYRSEHGLGALTLLVSLGAAARHHAESMASYNYFDFTLVPEGITFAENVAVYGYAGAYTGANIAAGPGSFNAEVVIGQWQASPSQDENLLNPSFTVIGLGSSLNSESDFVNYWAAAFGSELSGDIALGCDASATDSSPAPTVTAPETPTPSPSPSPTVTSTPTETPTPTITPTVPPTQTETPPWVITPTRTATVPASATPTATVQAQATATATATTAVVSSPTPTVTVTAGGSTPPVTAACASDRDTVRAALNVVMSCAGFEPDEEVDVYFDDLRPSALLETVTADDEGQIEYTFLVPEIPAGRFRLIARSVESGLTATVGLDIRPGILISPRSGDPGDVIGADLTGFQPGEEVTIFWNDESLTSREVRQVTVGEDGSATTTFRAPASTAGSHTIEAVGLGGGKASASFTIDPS